jgi:hypothetical protein
MAVFCILKGRFTNVLREDNHLGKLHNQVNDSNILAYLTK